MELNPSSAENVLILSPGAIGMYISKGSMQGSNQTEGLFVISSEQQRHCMVESTGYYEGGVGRVLSLNCILFSMVVFGNLMTFEIIELD